MLLKYSLGDPEVTARVDAQHGGLHSPESDWPRLIRQGSSGAERKQQSEVCHEGSKTSQGNH